MFVPDIAGQWGAIIEHPWGRLKPQAAFERNLKEKFLRSSGANNVPYQGKENLIV